VAREVKCPTGYRLEQVPDPLIVAQSALGAVGDVQAVEA